MACPKVSFPFEADYYSIVCAIPVGGHPSCFRFLAAVNNAALNTGVQIALWDAAFNSLALYTEAELLDRMVVLFPSS